MPSPTTWYLLMPTLAVSALLLAAGLSGAWYVHQVNRDVSQSLDKTLAAAQSAEQLVLAVRDVRVKLHRLIGDGDASHLEDARFSVAAIEGELLVLEQLAAGTSLRDDRLADRVRDFRQRFEQLRDDDTARHEAQRLLATLNRDILPPAEKLLADRQRMMSEASRHNQATADRIGLGLLLLAVCGAAAGLLIGFGVARGVHRSLVEITVPVRDIAGRLNEVVGPIKVASHTDLSQLDGALRVLADKTSDVVKRLQDSQRESLRHEQLAAVGQLAAGLAHELRNPLMSVKLLVQTARERPDTSLSNRDLAVIEDEVTRLEKMLQTFLDFARPPQPEKQLVDLSMVVQDTLEFVRPRAEQQGVTLGASRPDLELLLEADESQLRQVILNLLINSLDALPGGGTVDVDVRWERNPEARVFLRVSDDGPGVAEEVLERVFEPFVSTKVTGIGLGLSISRRIVESHNGTISVRNREQGGAEFTVALPLPPVRESLTPVPQAWEGSPRSGHRLAPR